MAKRATLGTIANFMSQQTKKQLEKEKTTNWANLLSIRPDPGQPRRLLPSKLAERFISGQLSPQDVITEWLNSPSEALQLAQDSTPTLDSQNSSAATSTKQPNVNSKKQTTTLKHKPQKTQLSKPLASSKPSQSASQKSQTTSAGLAPAHVVASANSSSPQSNPAHPLCPAR